MASPRAVRSIHGNSLQVGQNEELRSHGFQVTSPCVDAAITISAEGASVSNQRDITITLKDADGNALTYAEMVEIILFSSSAMTDFVATGGSTGIAAGASGKLLAVVAKKIFRAISTTSGVIACIYTDTGSDAGYLGVRLPGGRIVAGGTVTNA